MKTFTNELGNQVTVDVAEKVINGVDGILIRMEGPTSRTENEITRMEAKVLFDQLKEVLRQG